MADNDTRPDAADKAADARGDEFFENFTQLNALNGKRTYDEFQDISLTAARRSQAHFDDLNSRTLNSYDQLLTLQSKVNGDHFESLNELRVRTKELETKLARNTEELAYQYRRHSDLAADSYWNPVSAGAGMNLTAGAVPSNRTIDQETAVAGGAVANASAAVASAVAKQVDATITPILAALQQTIQALTTATTSIANVVNQTQPKTAA